MRGSTDRSGQTSIDFLIGISLFTVTLLFVLQVASTSVVNVAPESQTKEAIAERTGTIVYQNYTDTDGGSVLELSDEDAKAAFAIADDSGYKVNVTVRNAATGALTNSTGPGIPQGPSSRVAGERRVVEAKGNTSVVRVRIWGIREGGAGA